MEILQLKYFENAAKKENISKTAQKFMVPPSSVSMAIKKLENELGVKLFDRTANSLKLNENGKVFLKAVENAFGEIKKAASEISESTEISSGKINLLILTNRRAVTEAIKEFKQKYPDVSFNIRHEWHEEYVDLLDFDIVIADRINSPGDFFAKDFVWEEIFLAVSSKAGLAKKTSVNLKELMGEKFITMAKGSCLREYTDSVLKKNGVDADIVIECDDPFYIREYVKMGLGVTFFPYASWGRHLDEKIKLLKINEGIYRRSYMYVNKNASEIAEKFAEAMEESVNKGVQ